MNRESNPKSRDGKNITKHFLSFRFHFTAFDLMTFGIVMVGIGVVLGCKGAWYRHISNSPGRNEVGFLLTLFTFLPNSLESSLAHSST